MDGDNKVKNKIKFTEKNVKKYLDERILFWEDTLKDLKENSYDFVDAFWAMDKNKSMVSCYIEIYKNTKKDIFGE